MALTPSTMQELGSSAADFTLNSFDNSTYTLSQQDVDKGLLVVFMCNHCPYVVHIREKLVENIRNYQQQGIAVVAVNANDYSQYPDDSPAKMAEDAKTFDYSFPYLVDEDQKVAKTYGAACTPDFFLYDSALKLVYRGQFDCARPGNKIAVTGEDLNKAVDQLVSKEPVTVEQRPSMGCNIKWKKGNEPDYFNKG